MDWPVWAFSFVLTLLKIFYTKLNVRAPMLRVFLTLAVHTVMPPFKRQPHPPSASVMSSDKKAAVITVDRVMLPIQKAAELTPAQASGKPGAFLVAGEFFVGGASGGEQPSAPCTKEGKAMGINPEFTSIVRKVIEDLTPVLSLDMLGCPRIEVVDGGLQDPSFWGECCPRDNVVRLDGNRPWTEGAIRGTVAHELRHYWQFVMLGDWWAASIEGRSWKTYFHTYETPLNVLEADARHFAKWYCSGMKGECRAWPTKLMTLEEYCSLSDAQLCQLADMGEEHHGDLHAWREFYRYIRDNGPHAALNHFRKEVV
jgi:hypothetical protein